MIEFTLLYKNRRKEKIQAESRESLIKNFSKDDATAFQENVKEIHWTIDDFHYIENVDSGKIEEIEILEGGKDF